MNKQVDRRHKNADWLLAPAEEPNELVTDESVVMALLMDLRDELKTLNRTQRAILKFLRDNAPSL